VAATAPAVESRETERDHERLSRCSLADTAESQPAGDAAASSTPAIPNTSIGSGCELAVWLSPRPLHARQCSSTVQPTAMGTNLSESGAGDALLAEKRGGH
jgi:hypothetical protein